MTTEQEIEALLRARIDEYADQFIGLHPLAYEIAKCSFICGMAAMRYDLRKLYASDLPTLDKLLQRIACSAADEAVKVKG